MVINPLVDNLPELKDSELEQKIQDLSKKYWMVSNPNMRNQIGLFIDMHREQQNQKRNKDLDNLIQVN